MPVIEDPAAAQAATERATRLVDDVVDGVLAESKEAAAAAEADELFAAVLDFRRAEGNGIELGELLVHLGYAARHVRFDHQAAKAHFEEAAELFERNGAPRRRVAALMELAEIEPTHPAVRPAVDEALAEGLPDDLDHTEDPKRLAFALREAGDSDGAYHLYESLVAEADSRGAGGRVAMLLRDTARILEDDRRDRAGATAALERAVASAEAAGDKHELGIALLRLSDIHMESGRRKQAEEVFRRAEALRGLPRYQKELIGLMRTYFPE